MSKGLSGLLSLVLVVAFAGCGGGDSTEDAGETRDQRDRSRDTEPAAPAGNSFQLEAPDDAAEPAIEEDAGPEEPMTDEAPAGDESAQEAGEDTAQEAGEDKEAAAATDGLTGTKWSHNEIVMEFREGNKVFLKGGPLASIAPAGHETTYALKDGKLEVEVFDQVHTGTWDGITLSVGGEDARPVE